MTELLSSDFPDKHEAYRKACIERMKEEQFVRQKEMDLVSWLIDLLIVETFDDLFDSIESPDWLSNLIDWLIIRLNI